MMFLALAACQSTPPDLPLVRIVATATGYTLAPRVPGGLVRIRLVNQDTAMHEAGLAHLTGPEASLAAYLRVVQAGEEYPPFARDLGGAALALPGDSNEVVVRLPAGPALVMSWRNDDILHGFIAATEVGAANDRVQPPSPATEVVLTEYAIAPFTLRPGGQWLHVINRGHTEHEFTLLRHRVGHTTAEWYDWRTTGEKGEAPSAPIAGTTALMPDGEAWLYVEATPATYLATCAVETVGKVPRHHTLGMQRELVVQ